MTMGSVASYLAAYLLGGVTFLPLVVLAVWHQSARVPESAAERAHLDAAQEERQSRERGEPKGYRELRAGEVIDRASTGLKAGHAGWITVTKEFYSFPQINPDDFKVGASNAEMENGSAQPPPGQGHAGANTGLFTKMIKGGSGGSATDDETREGDPDSAALGANKLKQIRKRNRFHGVIKHGNLFLYSDESQKNVRFAIVLDNYLVTMWPKNITEGQLFTKRSAICLLSKKDFFASEAKTQGLVDMLEGSTDNQTLLPKSSYFLYGDTSYEKEEWYTALVRATNTDFDLEHCDTTKLENRLNPSLMAKPLYYNTADMLDLIETLNSTEHQLTTKWLNALIGRLFLATYKTEEFKKAFRDKIESKLKKIRTPGFLDQLQIHRIDVGHSAPFFTNPRLKTLSPEGNLEILVNASYQGKTMLEIATKLFLNIGVGFKQRQFDIIMKITINKIEGELLLKIKPQPSNRLWYTFSKMPEIDLNIEPVFSSRSISYGIVTDILESRFKDAIKSGIVYPFFDDFVFYKPTGEIYKGGIFDKTIRTDASVSKPAFETPLPQRSKSTKSSNDSETNNESEKLEVSNTSIMSRTSAATSISKTTEKDVQSLKSKTAVDANESNTKDKNNTEILEEDVSHASEQIKDSVIKSYSKIKQWYKKNPSNSDNSSTVVNPSNPKKSNNKDLNYTPPEMISNRRKKSFKAEPYVSEKQTQPTNTATGSSFVLHSSNVTVRPSGEAFINLERKRGASRSSRFSSISSIDENSISTHLHNQNNISSSPASPEMFINEKFKSPTAPSSATSANFDVGSNPKTRMTGSPAVMKFNNLSGDKINSMDEFNAAITTNGLQDSPLPKIREPAATAEVTASPNDQILHFGETNNNLQIHKTRTMVRKPPPLSTDKTEQIAVSDKSKALN